MILPESEMTAYSSAKNTTLLLLICCDVDIEATGINAFIQQASASSDPQMIRVPVNSSARSDLLKELKQSKKYVGLQLEHNMGWIYTFPPSKRPGGRVTSAESKRGGPVDNAEVVNVDYVCVCTDSFIEGGLKLLEQRLEILLSPMVGVGLGGLGYNMNNSREELINDTVYTTNNNSFENTDVNSISSSSILKKYEENLRMQVQKYVDQVQEELTSEQADVLRDVDDKVAKKEDQLKKLKEELVQERKLQENLLRDMRVFGDQNNNNSTNNNGTDVRGKTKSRISK
jgi:hypothetical protein